MNNKPVVNLSKSAVQAAIDKAANSMKAEDNTSCSFIERVEALVGKSTFYRAPGEVMLRIEFHDDEDFTCVDENSTEREDFKIRYDEVVPGAIFYVLHEEAV